MGCSGGGLRGQSGRPGNRLRQNHGWNGVSILALAQTFALNNPNALSAVEWSNVAVQLPVNQHAETAAFARTAGWNAVSLRQLAVNLVAQNPNHLTAADWAAQAAAVGANLHAETTLFARMAGSNNSTWDQPSILQLIQNRSAVGGNPNHFTVAEWVAIAALLPSRTHANVTTFAQANGWNHANVITLATLFGANNFHQTVADWLAMGNRIRGGAWAQYTANAMHCRGRGWPDQVEIRIARGGALFVWHLEGSNDGIVYRQTGVGYPHITLHNLGDDSPDQWWRLGNFHVVTGGDFRPYDFYRRAYTPYNYHPPQLVTPTVTEVSGSFCSDLGF
jgi:hypothetical protein